MCKFAGKFITWFLWSIKLWRVVEKGRGESSIYSIRNSLGWHRYFSGASNPLLPAAPQTGGRELPINTITTSGAAYNAFWRDHGWITYWVELPFTITTSILVNETEKKMEKMFSYSNSSFGTIYSYSSGSTLMVSGLEIRTLDREFRFWRR